VKATELVVQVRCLHCRHKSILSGQELATFGIKPDSPVASFVKRLRCTNCGSGSVMANRTAGSDPAIRRLRT
jgi:DNA-directed RNA polymerase subunit RPC12/RpoP